MKNELIQRFGEERVVDLPVQDGELPLLMLDLEAKIPVNVLLTNGLSEYKMPVHEKEKGKEFNELCFCLPGYWDWEDRSNPNTNWVFHWIQRLAKYVQENETWFGHGHTMPCGKEMQSLSSTMKRMHFSDQLGFIDAKSQRPAVPHGLRSTFRTWAAENKHSREAAELQLAHKFGNNVEHAYYRTDIIDERAQLLIKWHAFLEGKA